MLHIEQTATADRQAASVSEKVGFGVTDEPSLRKGRQRELVNAENSWNRTKLSFPFTSWLVAVVVSSLLYRTRPYKSRTFRLQPNRRALRRIHYFFGWLCFSSELTTKLSDYFHSIARQISNNESNSPKHFEPLWISSPSSRVSTPNRRALSLPLVFFHLDVKEVMFFIWSTGLLVSSNEWATPLIEQKN